MFWLVPGRFSAAYSLSRLIVGDCSESATAVHGGWPGLHGKRQAVSVWTPVGGRERADAGIPKLLYGVVQSLILLGFS